MKSKKRTLVGKRCLAVLLALSLTCAGVVINQAEEANAEETTATVSDGRFYSINTEPLQWQYDSTNYWKSSRLGNGYINKTTTFSPGKKYAVALTFTAPEKATIKPTSGGYSIQAYRINAVSESHKDDGIRLAVYLNDTKIWPEDSMWSDMITDTYSADTVNRCTLPEITMEKGDKLRWIVENGGSGNNSWDALYLNAAGQYVGEGGTLPYVSFTNELNYGDEASGNITLAEQYPNVTLSETLGACKKSDLISQESVLITENTLTGTTFTEHQDNPFKTAKGFRQEILTYEATVKFPADFTGAGGTVIGNRGWGGDTYSLDINESGNVSLYLNDINTSGGSYTYTFADTNVYTGKWVHIAVVRDKANKTVTCYIDGRQAGVITADNAALNIISLKVECVGGDLTEENTHCFQGSIYDVLLYSDMRTDREILLDVGKVDEDNEHLIAHYNFDDVTSETTTIPDQNGKEAPSNYPIYKWWSNEAPALKDYAYSFAVVGDTQTVNWKYKEEMNKIYDYICDNVKTQNIKFVFGLGDITEHDTTTGYEDEWQRGYEQIHRMDGLVAYNLNRGNHDQAGFATYFPYSDYEDVLDGSYGQKVTNSFQTLTVEGIDYLIFSLDYSAEDAVLNWASDIIASLPNHNVIITTHAYLDGNGNRWTTTMSGVSNEGQEVWDKLISQHSNISLVLCGHTSGVDIIRREDPGVNGNTVTQMMINPQEIDAYTDGGAGMVAMFYFSEDGKNVQVRYYSTIREQYFLDNTQFEFDLNVVEDAETTPFLMDVEALQWQYDSTDNWKSSRLGNGYITINNYTRLSPGKHYAAAVTFTAPEDAITSFKIQVYRTNAVSESHNDDGVRLAVYLNDEKIWPMNAMWSDMITDTTVRTITLPEISMKDGDKLRFVVDNGGALNNNWDLCWLNPYGTYRSESGNLSYFNLTNDLVYGNKDAGNVTLGQHYPSSNLQEPLASCKISDVISYESILVSDLRNHGDANADNHVNVKDLVRTLRYLEDNTVEIESYGADVYTDNYEALGTVTETDTEYLRKYLIGSYKFN
ncbi:MAG: hypothetical protein IJE23_05760 [Tyzzerella sp.]|nr:hypothetical protein [Tyzzerella sp.]